MMNKKDVFVFIKSKEDFNRVVELLTSYGENMEPEVKYKFAPATVNDHFYFDDSGTWTYYNGIYGQFPSEEEITIDQLEDLLKEERAKVQQKAKELVEFFLPIVYPYSGSGMLTDTPDAGVMLSNAKKCALKVVEEILSTDCRDMGEGEFEEHINVHEKLKREIEAYEI